MSALTKKVMDRIREEHIVPAPFWLGRFKNGAYWLGTLGMIAGAGLATALSLHVILEIDWDAFRAAHFSWYDMLTSGVPILFLLLIFAFLTIGIVLLRHTRHGYRYAATRLIGLFIAISVGAGYAIEFSPWDEPLEALFLGALPHSEAWQREFVPSASRQWSEPDKGLLGGVVTGMDASGIQLLDEEGKTWEVRYQETTVFPEKKWQLSDKIKVIGEREDEIRFMAREIRLWEKKHRASSRSAEE